MFYIINFGRYLAPFTRSPSGAIKDGISGPHKTHADAADVSVASAFPIAPSYGRRNSKPIVRPWKVMSSL